MGEVLKFPAQSINVQSVKQNLKKIDSGLILPATEDVSCELAAEHTAEPIKSLDDIYRITEFLVAQHRYRDNMLFIVGINFGLRVSDLRILRFSHLINENFVFKESFAILEKKTSNTRKHKKNRHITINNAVIESVMLFLENTADVSLSDFLFRSTSNRCTENKPMHRNSIDRIIKGIGKDLGLGNKMATHSMRKTFAYHQMVMCNNDTRKLLLLQKMFGHSTSAQTLDYIGITGDEIEEAYRNLNLGSRIHSYLDSNLVEFERSVM